jgi:hypothetical protein
MEYFIILGNGITDAVIGICIENIYKKIKSLFKSNKNENENNIMEDNIIKNINIDFIPQKTEDEIILLTQKNKNPKIFKKNKSVQFVDSQTETDTNIID